MPRTDTKIFSPDEGMEEAVSLLKQGEVVAIPTETVYGLAANALNPSAVEKIFAVKGRPSDNPLIVHIAKTSDAFLLAKEIPKEFFTLAERFWPGPLTMILKKNPIVPDSTTGGLDTVAIRLPSHPVARQLIESCGFPLAAPSANLSGTPSPTTAQHVYEDLKGRLTLILDGGSCSVGVESTVLSLYGDVPAILRPGGISYEQIGELIPNVVLDDSVLHSLKEGERPLSPGTKYKHYAPRAEIILLDGSLSAFGEYIKEKAKPQDMILCFEGEEKAFLNPCITMGREHSAETQAKELFSALRKVDDSTSLRVYARCPEKSGMALAVYNRLIRAAGFKVITL